MIITKKAKATYYALVVASLISVFAGTRAPQQVHIGDALKITRPAPVVQIADAYKVTR